MHLNKMMRNSSAMLMLYWFFANCTTSLLGLLHPQIVYMETPNRRHH